MKDKNTSTIAPTEIIEKMFLPPHMLKMTEYYSKTPMGGCGNFNPRQELLQETFNCLPAKKSIENK